MSTKRSTNEINNEEEEKKRKKKQNVRRRYELLIESVSLFVI